MEQSLKPFFKSVLILLLLITGEAAFIAGTHSFLLKKCRESNIIQEQMEKQNADIFSDMKCFPIPLSYQYEIYYEDTYGAARQSGGHEGCDIMDSGNSPGKIPIVSATDGTITNMGWLYLGGYRIGITSDSGIYYYYAHLDSYAAGMKAGKTVSAGELVGFMGNTGEGEEGTEGNFPVHLHFGIYIENEMGNEETVNSYPYLRKIDGE